MPANYTNPNPIHFGQNSYLNFGNGCVKLLKYPTKVSKIIQHQLPMRCSLWLIWTYNTLIKIIQYHNLIYNFVKNTLLLNHTPNTELI